MQAYNGEWDIEPYFLSITFEGDSEALLWRYPDDKILQGMELIVPPGFEVAVFRDGHLMDVLHTGCHLPGPRLFPVYRKFYNIPTDGVTPISAELIYLNRQHPLRVDWETHGAIRLKSMASTHIFEATLSGTVEFEIKDTHTFLSSRMGKALLAGTLDQRSFLKEPVHEVIGTLTPALLEEGILTLSPESASDFFFDRVSRPFSSLGLEVVSLEVETVKCTERIEHS